ncbi:hypothetical protein J2853_003262 [Streptosporangium lutulentum]|uniref:Nitroreductase family protein n=1 Tax=Streptosporangium lutulentum TaxID=1461250 RepID=A0ABT9QBD3_9ACTN|nr:hypothetical protein [Streptosporangium lutulentum]
MNHPTLHVFHTRTRIRLHPGLHRFHDELSVAALVATARAPVTAQNPAPYALVPLLLPDLARIQTGGPTTVDHGGRDA